MLEEKQSLHNALVAQLKESATQAYNEFFRAYELLNDDKNKSNEMFLRILKNSDYLVESLKFYDDRFFDLDRAEDYLYIGQILSLQIKASHNLAVIGESNHNLKAVEEFNKRKIRYKEELYYYYLLAGKEAKIHAIMDAFCTDAAINEEIKTKAKERYQKFISRWSGN